MNALDKSLSARHDISTSRAQCFWKSTSVIVLSSNHNVNTSDSCCQPSFHCTTINASQSMIWWLTHCCDLAESDRLLHELVDLNTARSRDSLSNFHDRLRVDFTSYVNESLTIILREFLQKITRRQKFDWSHNFARLVVTICYECYFHKSNSTQKIWSYIVEICSVHKSSRQDNNNNISL